MKGNGQKVITEALSPDHEQEKRETQRKSGTKNGWTGLGGRGINCTSLVQTGFVRKYAAHLCIFLHKICFHLLLVWLILFFSFQKHSYL